MVCGLSDTVSIHIYRGVLMLQLFLAAIGLAALIPSYFNTPSLEFVTWIEILFSVVCVISILEAIIAGAFVLMSIHPNKKALIPRHRILIAVLILGSGIALLVRAVMLNDQGVPECSTTVDRKGRGGKIVEEQEPCQELFKKCLVGAGSILNAILYAVTAFADPHKIVYGTDSAGNYGNVGVFYSAP